MRIRRTFSQEFKREIAETIDSIGKGNTTGTFQKIWHTTGNNFKVEKGILLR
jgi:hypothetical protein